MLSLIRHSLANSIFSPNDFFGQWFEERYEKLPARRIRLIQEKPAALMAEDSDVVRRGDYAALRCVRGVAPVPLRSGKSLMVKQRQDGHGRLHVDAFPQGSRW